MMQIKLLGTNKHRKHINEINKIRDLEDMQEDDSMRLSSSGSSGPESQFWASFGPDSRF